MAVPSRFRIVLQSENEMILSQGLEGCLNLYPLQTWSALNDKLETLPIQNKIHQRAFKRMLFSSASHVSFDEEGRILLPQHLMEYAHLKKESVVIGLGDKIEVWSKDVWRKYEMKQKHTFAKLSSGLEL